MDKYTVLIKTHMVLNIYTNIPTLRLHTWPDGINIFKHKKIEVKPKDNFI